MLHLWSSAKVVHASRKISSHTAATTGSSSASSKGHVMIARCLHDLCVAHVCGAPLSTTDIVTLAITHTQVIQRKMSMAPKCSHNWLWGAVWTSCSMDWGSVFRPHLAVLFILDKQQHLRGAHRATAWRGVSCRGLHIIPRRLLEGCKGGPCICSFCCDAHATSHYLHGKQHTHAMATARRLCCEWLMLCSDSLLRPSNSFMSQAAQAK